MLIAYPAVFQLHAGGWGEPGPDGGITLPPTVPASSQYLEQHGAYLVDVGYICFLWIGQLVTPQLIKVRFFVFLYYSLFLAFLAVLIIVSTSREHITHVSC